MHGKILVMVRRECMKVFLRYGLFSVLGITFAFYCSLVLALISVSSVGSSALSFILIGIGALGFRVLLTQLMSAQKCNSGYCQTTFYSSFGICALLAMFVI